MSERVWFGRISVAVAVAALVVMGCDIDVQDDAATGLTAGAKGETGQAPAQTTSADDGGTADDGATTGSATTWDDATGPGGEDTGPGPGSASATDEGSGESNGDAGLPDPGDTDGFGTSGDTASDTDPFDTDGFGTEGDADPFDTDGFDTGLDDFCSFLEDEKTCTFFDDECAWDSEAAACVQI